jgi:hypothetical protein
MVTSAVKAMLGTGKIRAGNGRVDTRDGQRRADVHAFDPSVRMRASQHPSVKHVRQVQVGTELSSTGHLVDAVRTNGTAANELEIFRFCHFSTPLVDQAS